MLCKCPSLVVCRETYAYALPLTWGRQRVSQKSSFLTLHSSLNYTPGSFRHAWRVPCGQRPPHWWQSISVWAPFKPLKGYFGKNIYSHTWDLKLFKKETLGDSASCRGGGANVRGFFVGCCDSFLVSSRSAFRS